ncbi:SMP-30/gluconolactonase/LRE family protein [Pseudooceanicola nitratireducens]|uniref:SMP-30/gluconolactonase/LRE family protein n=1 Tax=Pseudooceanicola nitratireducens TaxID=517719 RepID=UPI0023EF593C|nr:SMP-30/gluconolactonase/LRE family protein [Pseudooceanicola nitratireducens]
MTETATFHTPMANLLGESPLWDHRTNRFYWVDANLQTVSYTSDDNPSPVTWHYGVPIGSIGLAANGLVAALPDGFGLIDATSGAMARLADVPAPANGFRLNDGKADRAGRFIAGHMSPAGGTAGEVWSVEDTGRTRRIETGVGLSNGLCFSPAGDVMYFADTYTGILRRYAYDTTTGILGARHDLVDCRLYGSMPDGATVDAEGCIWVALVLARKVVRFSPQGELLQTLDTPMDYPTCPAFGGPDLDRLFVTSISDSGGKITSTAENAGRIAVFDGLGTRGLPEGVLGQPQ